MMNVRTIAWFAAAGLLPVVITASAQSYPAKPLRFMLGFAPGGASDIVARIVGGRLSEVLASR